MEQHINNVNDITYMSELIPAASSLFLQKQEQGRRGLIRANNLRSLRFVSYALIE